MFLQPLLLLVPVLVPVVSQHASGLPVEVFEGAESVKLPCQVKVSVSSGSTSVWDRDDFRIPTVHVRQPDGDYLKDQNQHFKGRTSMMEDALQTGDLSLTLRRPTFTDSGTFTCTVRRFGEDLHQEDVELLVKEAPSQVWPWVLVALVVLLVLVVAAVVWHYKLKKKTKAVILPETVEIREGVKSVLLPFKTNRGLPRDVRVEWTRPDLRNIRIHVFENGQTQSKQQDNRYEGRTKMKADLLGTGDVSLTLKNPQPKDCGLYDCVVSRGGDLLEKKTVTLRVKESLMEEVEVPDREEFVLLPFNTIPADLPPEAKVVWTRTDKRSMVHEYQNGQNQSHRQNQEYLHRTQMNPDALKTGDLTLTLKDPRLRDSGVFICTVYDDGKILRRKVLTLTVKVYQVEKVNVEEGRRSVVLPFKATPRLLSEHITVEWRLSDLEDVVLYTYHGGLHRPTEDQVYGGHTEMNEDLMTTGDLSLTISDLRLTESVYICTISNERGEILQQKVVVLIVRALQIDIVEIPKGETSVSLPCTIQPPLDEDIRVEWTHPDSKHTKVITFDNGGIQTSKQDRVYRGRTGMDKNLQGSGDLSLRLKRPCVKDNGLYICTVYRGEEIKLRKMVTLSVKDPLDTSFTDPVIKTKKPTEDSSPENVPLKLSLDSSMNQA